MAEQASSLTADHPHATLEPPPLLLPVPGTEPRRRFRIRVDWDLIACGLHGHELVGRDAAALPSEYSSLAREQDGLRWHRCLRCEGWVALAPPEHPVEQALPPPDQIQLPLRGRRLRDRYVLRLIVLDRFVHGLILAAITVAIFLFGANKPALHRTYIRVLNAFQIGVGGPGGRSGLLGDVDKLFKLSTTEIYLVGLAAALYTALMAIEAFGLWHARRWAEYLTFFETGLLVPFELYEITSAFTVLKLITLLINVAIVLYLLIAHRLFGIRGGQRAATEAYGSEG